MKIVKILGLALFTFITLTIVLFAAVWLWAYNQISEEYVSDSYTINASR